MAACSAPGKLILFGEHAVVFGQPALSTAIDIRAEVYARPNREWLVDGRDLDHPRYAYVRAAVERVGAMPPAWLEVRSALPEGSGLGSSAAVSVASLGALHTLRGQFDPARIAKEGFDVEMAVQGRASPIDTTTATAGGAILCLPHKEDGLLWTIERNDQRWFLHQRTLPSIPLVVGFTGISAPTGPLVAKVRDLVGRESNAMSWIEEIGGLSLQGLRALQSRDWVAAGALMDRNHELLNRLGVGHPMLDKLVTAARPTSFGAKLTGAGGGGSMIALTNRVEDTIKAVSEAGGRAFVVHSESRGAVVLA